MSKAKNYTFTQSMKRYLNEFWWERVGELYEKLEPLDEFKELSAEEDEVDDKLRKNLSIDLQKVFHDYNDIVDKKYMHYRGFYYKSGFSDFPKVKEHTESNDYINNMITQHFEALEKQATFKELTDKEKELYSTLEMYAPEELRETLRDYANVVQRKYAQYQIFYYREGLSDCEEYLSVCTGNALWILGKMS